MKTKSTDASFDSLMFIESTPLHKIKSKTLKRYLRLQRLYVLSEAYNRYTAFYLSQCQMKNETTYKSAENLSSFINNIFNGNVSPSDFLKSTDELSNEVIDNYSKYKEWLDFYNNIFKREIVDAFCKHVEHSNNCNFLKVENMQFTGKIIGLIGYNFGIIPLSTLETGMQDICVFTKKYKKFNFFRFKKTLITIEKNYQEILFKKTSRIAKNLK